MPGAMISWLTLTVAASLPVTRTAILKPGEISDDLQIAYLRQNDL
jgi:hypothetical protein